MIRAPVPAYPPSQSASPACITVAMSTPRYHPPSFIAAALRRVPRRARGLDRACGEGAPVFSQDNYIAEAPKNPAGAKPGNRNAVRHGVYALESRLRAAAINRLIRQSHALADSVLKSPRS